MWRICPDLTLQEGKARGLLLCALHHAWYEPESRCPYEHPMAAGGSPESGSSPATWTMGGGALFPLRKTAG